MRSGTAGTGGFAPADVAIRYKRGHSGQGRPVGRCSPVAADGEGPTPARPWGAIVRVFAALSALSLAGAAALVATPASAAPPGQPTCGSTLTADTVLHSNLVCAGNGLTLAAGVSLDLGGHTLRSTAGGVGLTIVSTGTATLKHGMITGWDAGVRTLLIFDGPGNGPLLVDGVTFKRNAVGVDGVSDGFGGKNLTVTGSTFADNTFAGVTAEFTSDTFDRTAFVNNNVGYWGDTGSEATLANTRFTGNDTGAIAVEASVTLTHATFKNNRRAISSDGSVAGIVVQDSRITGSDVAIHGQGAEVRVSGTAFAKNTTAVEIGPFGARLTGNTFRKNGTTVTLLPSVSGTIIVISDNTFRRNGDGLRLENADSSISVGGNDARNNTGWGIYAPGVTDLGGNTARHNGNQPQCVGVACP
ncbi:NosD domain-containing protein [Cellulomonas alba]|uniref:NosD domain-containing protein n=1 Tax=Cellulomonas alba TaxID=3053467 RepID=A0ABT7SIC4_9CELL|nr:right-handed parallel beta-helix repeat-containing protein [Cellulomonas alba]MDM7855314.1 NosD domain-containing protein [Cellulomonas alba]